MNPALFHVSRQIQWPEGDKVVEIAQGGSDYANPGQLVAEFEGEGDEFEGMTDAVKAGIAVALAWKEASPDELILIGLGCTHGDTMPFEGDELTDEVFAALMKKAEAFDEKLPRCSHCGDILPPTGKRYGNHFTMQDNEYPFCSSNCAELDAEFQEEQEAELEEEEDEDEEE